MATDDHLPKQSSHHVTEQIGTGKMKQNQEHLMTC